LAIPYTDISVEGLPLEDDGLIVNGGVRIWSDGSASNSFQDPTYYWGTVDLATARANLWLENGTYSYSPRSTTPWTAPNTWGIRISAKAIRFYATNGIIPNVAVFDNFSTSWAKVDQHATQGISSTLVTRAYVSEDLSTNNTQWLVADMQTWKPMFTASVLFDGVEEKMVLETDKTRDRAKYYQPADATDFDLTNVLGGFLTPWREDYSVEMGPTTSTPLGTAAQFSVHTTSVGTALDLHQSSRNTWRVNGNGRASRVKFENTQGRIRLMSVVLESDPKNISAGVAA
jgi:hypothetical protein